MSVVRHFVRIAWAAIIFAVLALAPTSAMAHAGHSHATRAIQQALGGASAGVSEAIRPIGKHSVVSVAAAAEQSPNDGECAGTCCKTGMTCCVVLFTLLEATPLPSGSAARLALPTDPSPTSLAPHRLRRPPKSFA
jgi:hypothetical protein